MQKNAQNALANYIKGQEKFWDEEILPSWQKKQLDEANQKIIFAKELHTLIGDKLSKGEELQEVDKPVSFKSAITLS